MMTPNGIPQNSLTVGLLYACRNDVGSSNSCPLGGLWAFLVHSISPWLRSRCCLHTRVDLAAEKEEPAHAGDADGNIETYSGVMMSTGPHTWFSWWCRNRQPSQPHVRIAALEHHREARPLTLSWLCANTSSTRTLFRRSEPKLRH